eukprot:TRINITY_DN92291_c0_g1_i1.p1 TRINITY_DN92291_c0_g1~~TRINITY_DN92291_c0_g1_i1.p1  ORF type:complete len:520 (-),score=73.27 TRINITY_DN92291_c0_g1_i1:102-1661(-)
MIIYRAQEGLCRLLFRCDGSVFIKALYWSIPNTIFAGSLALALWFFDSQLHALDKNEISRQIPGVNILWSGYTFVLGFLIVFRNNQAYTRFWEGASLIQQVRGEWFNACSSLFAFCTNDAEKSADVHRFQHLLVRLFSLLYCEALQQCCDLSDSSFDILDPTGIDHESLSILPKANDRCEVLIQWLQRLIIDADTNKTIHVAPPILSRAFQELSRGSVKLNEARKIAEIPFPFPYEQMITWMMLIHWVITPVIAILTISTWWFAVTMCFLVTTGFWSLIYIATELDQPFGDDANDLPVKAMQADFNRSLLALLDIHVQSPPRFSMEAVKEKGTRIIRSPTIYHEAQSSNKNSRMIRFRRHTAANVVTRLSERGNLPVGEAHLPRSFGDWSGKSDYADEGADEDVIVSQDEPCLQAGPVSQTVSANPEPCGDDVLVGASGSQQDIDAVAVVIQHGPSQKDAAQPGIDSQTREDDDQWIYGDTGVDEGSSRFVADAEAVKPRASPRSGRAVGITVTKGKTN